MNPPGGGDGIRKRSRMGWEEADEGPGVGAVADTVARRRDIKLYRRHIRIFGADVNPVLSAKKAEEGHHGLVGPEDIEAVHRGVRICQALVLVETQSRCGRVTRDV